MSSYNIVFQEKQSNQVELFLQFIQTLDFVASVQKIEENPAKEEFMSMEDMKKNYPDEWVLLGNPQKEEGKVLGGIVLFHSKDKRDLAKNGSELVKPYDSATHIYTGEFPKNDKIGIIRQVEA